MFIKKSDYNFLKSTRNSYEQSYYSARSEIQRLHSVIKRQEEKIEETVRSNAMKDAMLEARNNIIFRQTQEGIMPINLFQPQEPVPTEEDYYILEAEYEEQKALISHLRDIQRSDAKRIEEQNERIRELNEENERLEAIKNIHSSKIKDKNIKINRLETSNNQLREQIKKYQGFDRYTNRTDL